MFLLQNIVLASSAGLPASPTTSPNGADTTSVSPNSTASNGVPRSTPVQIQPQFHGSNGSSAAKPILTSRSSFSASAAAVAAGSPPQFTNYMPTPGSNQGSRRGSIDGTQYTANIVRTQSAQGNSASSNGNAHKAPKQVGPSKVRCENMQASVSNFKAHIEAFEDRIQVEQPTTPRSIKLWAVKKKLCMKALDNLKIAAANFNLLMLDDFALLSVVDTITKADGERTPSPVTARPHSSSVSAGGATSRLCDSAANSVAKAVVEAPAAAPVPAVKK